MGNLASPAYPARLSVAEAKAKLTVFDLWHICGYAGTPSKSCHCPFHEDGSKSFSLDSEGILWNCFAGCGGGDAITFLEKVKGLSQKDATKKFLEMAGGAPALPRPSRRSIAPPQPKPAKRWPEFEDICVDGAWSQLVRTRGFGLKGMRLAVERGVLKFGLYRGIACWFVTDSRREAAQARRMDNRPFQLRDETPKALTLGGSVGGWPVGSAEIGDRPSVLMVEGGPDVIAAFSVIAESRRQDVAPVAMLGATMRIDKRCRELFAEKTVRIVQQNDTAGVAATQRWGDELTAFGATVHVIRLTEFNGKDLNDAIKSSPLSEFSSLLP